MLCGQAGSDIWDPERGRALRDNMTSARQT